MAARRRQALNPKAGEVIVRMYRQGLGDCFLLAFGRSRGRDPLFVLIDCGVHMRQVDGRKRLAQVMDDIVHVSDKEVDIVVGTHAHADHLVGFVQKGSPFLDDDVKIERTWVAWTEKFGDEQADRLREKHGAARDAIDKAVQKARDRANDAGIRALAERIEAIRGFESVPPESVDDAHAAELEAQLRASLANTPAFAPLFGARAKRPSSNELAYGLLLAKSEEEAIFWEAGESRALEGVPNVRVLALGPPRDEQLLKKDKPSKIRGTAHDYKETYLSALASSVAFRAAPALGVSADLSDEHRHPFSAEFRCKRRLAMPVIAELPAPSEETEDLDALFRAYDDPGSSWRRIDGDWLRSAEELALHLDGDTNNTSLVLAFELGDPGEGEILLFTADAQVGNWLSWRDQSYGRGAQAKSADDIMRRTRLYKVGHHGSHNATVKADPRETGEDGEHVPFGLELMNDIIAMIPVDRAAADRNMPTPWSMPHEPMYRRLRAKADRRVLRADQSLAPLSRRAAKDRRPTSSRWSKVPGLEDVHWREALQDFEDGTTGPLYYDVRFRYET